MRLGIGKPSQYHLDALKKKMVPQGNWMRQLMCDGKVERRWGTYQGTSEASTSEARQAKRNKRNGDKRSEHTSATGTTGNLLKLS